MLGGSAIEVRSAGLVDKWAGEPAHPTMIEAAALRGYNLADHRGTQINHNLLAWADLVLAMDADILAALGGLTDERVDPRLALYLGDRDVPDPWGQPASTFGECVDLIEAGARRLAYDHWQDGNAM